MLLTRLPVLLAVVVLLGPVAAFGADEKTDTKSRARLEKLWTDLGSTDEGRALRATLGLAAQPKEAVPFLRQHLRTVKVDPAEVAKLVKQLDSDEFDTRDAAARELEYLGKYAKAVLEKEMASASSAEVKNRLRQLIDRMPSDQKPAPAVPKLMGRSVSIANNNGEIKIIIDGKPLDLSAMVPPPPPTPYAGWVRAVRATAVLEHINTPEARVLLERLAGGEADAPPTKAAKEALERLKKGE